MTTSAPPTPGTSQNTPRRPADSAPPAVGDVALQLSRPTCRSIVIHVAGELDATTTPRLYELVAPRLSSMIETVILDLSQLRFLGVPGLELLAYVRRRATQRGMVVWIVDGPVCVDRALRAAGEHVTVPKFATVEAALAELITSAPESADRVVN